MTMSRGDPNFTPSMKGEFAIDPRGRPKIHRRIHGQLVTEELVPQRQDDESGISELLAGLSSSDLRGPVSGFGRHVAANYSQAEAGSGDPVNQHRRSTNYSNELMQGGEQLDQGYEFSEDVGESDLYGQPATSPRAEFGDFAEGDAETIDGPANSDDEEDIWATDIFDEFADNRHERTHDEPTFQARPHRQYEASVGDKLADDLDNMFDGDSNTFNRRGL